MVLVDYSSSESDSEEDNKTTEFNQHEGLTCKHEPPVVLSTKRKADQVCDNTTPRTKLPPLPTTFHSLYASNVRTSRSDDPTLYGGRKRQIPHVQGNWPSHVYLEWLPNIVQRDQIEDLISRAQGYLSDNQVVNTFLRSSLGVQQPLHISLSAPLVLTTSVKDLFQSSLFAGVRAARIPSFHITCSNLDWVSNFDESRYFLILRLNRPQSNGLNCILRTCNNVCKQFDLSLLYQRGEGVGIECMSNFEIDHASAMAEDRSHAFHISVAWTLVKPSQEAKRAAKLLDLGPLREEQINFSEVKVKIGNVIDNIKLATL